MIIKVGDIVRIKSREELLKEGYKENPFGIIEIPEDNNSFTPNMDRLAGMMFKVKAEDYDETCKIVRFIEDDEVEGVFWTITEHIVALVEGVEESE